MLLMRWLKQKPHLKFSNSIDKLLFPIDKLLFPIDKLLFPRIFTISSWNVVKNKVN